ALQYDFLKADLDVAVSIALRFTLSQPGVHTAIVGTKKPGRWKHNAALLESGPLPQAEIDAIRARWNEIAETSWVGQV
ncbi:MAG: aldo/keto reductase, partial [Candidatus Hydrogenedentes bacterium]|nr:aldo/keto reductase [Candidatus Hydrogenedentota bacterium]